jgi:flagellar hook-associated protein 2
MSASLFSPLKFTGVSKYATDFQSIVDRAVSIAALPLQQAQNEQTDLLAKKQLLSDLNTSATDIAAKLAALGTVGTNHGVAASSSDTSKVSIAGTNASAAAVYNITDVSSLAHAASETSSSGYATSDKTAVSASGKIALIFGPPGHETTTAIQLDSTTNNLIGLRNKINSLNLGVNANILTTGTGANPNYLSIAANSSGAATLRLVENPGTSQTDVLTSANQGADTVFKLNGVTVQKSGTLINDVVPGVSFNILAKTATNESVSITLGSDSSTISQALQDLVSSYNTAMQKVDAQIGQSAGLLSGDSLVREIQQSLRSIVGYAGTGSIKSVADLGIEMSKDGQMSFKAATFNALSSTQIDAAFSFLGTTRTGLGGLSSRFTAISDPVTGMVKLQQDQYDKADARLTTQVEDLAARITDMQTALASKLEIADQLLASLDSQQTTLNASITSLNYSLYGTSTSSSGA